MKKWTVLGSRSVERWQLLSEAITAAGGQNHFEPWTQSMDDFNGLVALKPYDHVRISSRVAAQVMKYVPVQSTWTTLLGVIDGMNQTPHGWWPLCALYESFGHVLVEIGQELDKRGNVLVAGAGSAARIAIAAFFKSGFSSFLVTNTDEAEGLNLVREIKARFFGMTVEWVPMDRIVLLPGESSVICNCTPNSKDNFLLKELSYMNFLRRPGFLFDLELNAEPGVFMQEARDAGVRSISGLELAARTDALWAQWGFQTAINTASYQERLFTLLARLTTPGVPPR